MFKSFRSSLPWALCFLGVLEAGARWVIRPEYLTAQRSYGPETCFFKGKALASQHPEATLIVGGDSTGERGVDACVLGARLGQPGLNVAIASGSVSALRQLLDAHQQAGGKADRLVLVASSFGLEPVSASFPMTFPEAAQTVGFANALVGRALALYGSRELLHRLLESRGEHARFDRYIAPHDACGLAVPDAAPPPAEYHAQLERYEKAWKFPAVAPTMGSLEGRLSASLQETRPSAREIFIVLAPYRSDVVPYVEARWPGDLGRLRSSWEHIASRSGARLLDCTRSSQDDGHFYDPFHLTAEGRARFSACLAEQLAGGRPCCEEPPSPRGRM